MGNMLAIAEATARFIGLCAFAMAPVPISLSATRATAERWTCQSSAGFHLDQFVTTSGPRRRPSPIHADPNEVQSRPPRLEAEAHIGLPPRHIRGRSIASGQVANARASLGLAGAPV